MDPTDLLVAAGLRHSYAVAAVAAAGVVGVGTLTASELRAVGVPPATAKRVAAALTLGRRTVESAPLEVIGSPRDVWRLLAPRLDGHPYQEVFYVVLINIRNHVLDVVEVARGSVAGVEVHPRDVFRAAVRASAAGIVLAHNHPSGDPTPSPEDRLLTTRLKDCGKLLGIPVVDHVVVTPLKFESVEGL